MVYKPKFESETRNWKNQVFTWNSVRSTLRAPSKRREAVIDETTYSFQDFNNVLRVKDHKVAVKFVILICPFT